MRTIPFLPMETVDMVNPLLYFFKCCLEETHLSELKCYLETFQEIRTQCVELVKKDESKMNELLFLKNHLEQWLSIVFYLISIFILEEDADNCALPFNFRWINLFDEAKNSTCGSILFEKNNCLYNLGATYSNLGFLVERNGSNNLRKEALCYFQKAACIFKMVSKDCQNCVSQDRKLCTFNKTQNVLCDIFDAVVCGQAQTCVYEKAVQDQLTRSLLSKLAHQIAEFFFKAFQHSNKISLFPIMLHEWFEAQRLAFLAASHYQKALFDLQQVKQCSQGYGGIITRLTVGERCCHEAEAVVKESTGVAINIAKLHQAIQSSLDELKHDNATVYLEVIPKEETLEPLESIDAVKLPEFVTPCLTTLVCNGKNIQNFFHHHVKHMKGNNLVDTIKARVSEMCETLVKKLQLIEKDFIPYVTKETPLYYLVQEFQDSSKEFLKTIFDHLEKIQLQGGFSEIDKRLRIISREALRCEKLLSDIDEDIWSLDDQVFTNHILSTSSIYKKSVERYLKKLQEATRVNSLVESRYKLLLPFQSKCTKILIEQDLSLLKRDVPISSDSKKLVLLYSLVETRCKKAKVWCSEFTQSLQENGDIATRIHKQAFQKDSVEELKEKIIKQLNTSFQEMHNKMDKCWSTFHDLQECWNEKALTNKQSIVTQRVLYFQKLDADVEKALQLFQDTSDGLSFFSELFDHLAQLKEQVTTLGIKKKETIFSRKNIDTGSKQTQSNSKNTPLGKTRTPSGFLSTRGVNYPSVK